MLLTVRAAKLPRVQHDDLRDAVEVNLGFAPALVMIGLVRGGAETRVRAPPARPCILVP